MLPVLKVETIIGKMLNYMVGELQSATSTVTLLQHYMVIVQNRKRHFHCILIDFQPRGIILIKIMSPHLILSVLYNFLLFFLFSHLLVILLVLKLCHHVLFTSLVSL